MQTWKRDNSIQCRFGYSRVVGEDDFGCESVHSTTLGRTGTTEFGRYQGEPDSELNVSSDDVTTLVQHGTPDLAAATRERDATNRRPEFKTLGEVLPLTV